MIGWAVEAHLSAILAIQALRMALEGRVPELGMIHHSDRGVQYACLDYVRILRVAGIQGSMSRVGNPYDNAKAESFMRTLKNEEIDGSSYKNLAELRQKISVFLEQTYNADRIHSSLGYMSPNEFEASLGP